MKPPRACLIIALALVAVQTFAQGFVNLDFEDATIAPTPVGGWVYPADPAQCFPGWTVGGGVVMYNDLSLGSPAVGLMGPEFPNFPEYAPLEGSYSTLFQYWGHLGPPPTLSQTGLIPADARSINFLVGSGQADASLTVNGASLALVPIPGDRLAGDVAAFAGQVVQLTFSTTARTEYPWNWLYFDDIEFSTTSIPEPTSSGLTLTGILLLGLWMKWPKISGPNAGGPRQVSLWTPLAARVGQFCRSAIKLSPRSHG